MHRGWQELRDAMSQYWAREDDGWSHDEELREEALKDDCDVSDAQLDLDIANLENTLEHRDTVLQAVHFQVRPTHKNNLQSELANQLTNQPTNQRQTHTNLQTELVNQPINQPTN